MKFLNRLAYIFSLLEERLDIFFQCKDLKYYLQISHYVADIINFAALLFLIYKEQLP